MARMKMSPMIMIPRSLLTPHLDIEKDKWPCHAFLHDFRPLCQPDIETRDPHTFDFGATYIGQWRASTNKIEGKGIMTFFSKKKKE